MTPERWKQVKEIFNAALDRSVDERETFLDEACGGDLSLRQQVEHFINRYEQAGDFMETPAAPSRDSLPADEAISAAALLHDRAAGRRLQTRPRNRARRDGRGLPGGAGR